MSERPITYRDSGVDISAANAFIKKIKPLIRKTDRPEVLSKIGHFAGLFALPQQNYCEPILVASTDGVGTKLKVALQYQKYDGLGQDLVAMSANDILCCGAEPLFFLDYFATGKLELTQAEQLVGGIVDACTSINCALLGGETAEMPSIYQEGEFDLAGFIVGIVERDKLIDGHNIAVGDQIIGLASSGLHSNGFSLVRKVLETKKLSLTTPYEPFSAPLGEVLLAPTKLYVNTVAALKKEFDLHGIAHITGGGLLENLDRVLPEACRAVIKIASWPRPPLFQMLQKWGSIAEEEMQRVFNCGIGLMLVVPAQQSAKVLQRLTELGEHAWAIGQIETRNGKEALQVL